jgi:hypothetical protein
VSDTWQGEGWWIASDGKWYPPESHSEAPAPASPLPAPPVTPAPGDAVPAAPTSRWLGRSPQPPATATATLGDSPDAPPVPPRSSRWSKPRGTPAPVTGPAPVTPVTYPLLDAPVRRPPPQRPVAIWVFISIGAVAVTLLIAYFVAIAGHGGVPVSEDGTITVLFPASGRPTFSGTIGGTALTGRVTDSSSTTTPSDNGSISASTRSFVYKGRYGGNAFVLHLSLTTPAPGAEGEWRVTGTDGSNAVNGEVNFDQATESNQIPFSGSIGSQPILGSAVITERSGGTMMVSVAYGNLP